MKGTNNLNINVVFLVWDSYFKIKIFDWSLICFAFAHHSPNLPAPLHRRQKWIETKSSKTFFRKVYVSSYEGVRHRISVVLFFLLVHNYILKTGHSDFNFTNPICLKTMSSLKETVTIHSRDFDVRQVRLIPKRNTFKSKVSFLG